MPKHEIARHHMHWKTPEEAFEWYVDRVPGCCWMWTGTINRTGYGQLMVKGVKYLAHRLSYQLHVGEIPEGRFVCHTCDNPGCVNPEHLFVGTPDDNSKDAVHKGRMRNGEFHHSAKLRVPDVLEIRAQWASGVPQKDLARKYGVSNKAISKVCRRQSWNHI